MNNNKIWNSRTSSLWKTFQDGESCQNSIRMHFSDSAAILMGLFFKQTKNGHTGCGKLADCL